MVVIYLNLLKTGACSLAYSLDHIFLASFSLILLLTLLLTIGGGGGGKCCGDGDSCNGVGSIGEKESKNVFLPI